MWYIDVEVQQIGWVVQGQSLPQRVAKAATTRVYNAEIGNKKRLQIDLTRKACKMKTFVPGYNTARIWPGWSSSYARTLASL